MDTKHGQINNKTGCDDHKEVKEAESEWSKKLTGVKHLQNGNAQRGKQTQKGKQTEKGKGGQMKSARHVLAFGQERQIQNQGNGAEYFRNRKGGPCSKKCQWALLLSHQIGAFRDGVFKVLEIVTS